MVQAAWGPVVPGDLGPERVGVGRRGGLALRETEHIVVRPWLLLHRGRPSGTRRRGHSSPCRRRTSRAGGCNGRRRRRIGWALAQAVVRVAAVNRGRDVLVEVPAGADAEREVVAGPDASMGA
eukprot:gene1311-biopygen19799